MGEFWTVERGIGRNRITKGSKNQERGVAGFLYEVEFEGVTKRGRSVGRSGAKWAWLSGFWAVCGAESGNG